MTKQAIAAHNEAALIVSDHLEPGLLIEVLDTPELTAAITRLEKAMACTL
jgi:hypothetical protein